MCSPKTWNRKGFTLVEVLVAVGLTVLVATVVAAVGGQIVRSWQQRSELAAVQSQARSILDLLATDLECILAPHGEGSWLAVALPETTTGSGLWEPAGRQKPESESWILDDPAADRLRFGPAGAWLRFFADLPDRPEGPVAVAYQLIRRADPAVPASAAGYRLHRTVVRPVASAGRPGVLESGYDLAPASPGAYQQAGPGNDGSVAGDPFAVRRPADPDSIVGEGVIDLGVRAWGRGAAGETVRLHPVGDDTREFLLAGPDAAGAIRSIDVVVRILTAEGVRQVARIEGLPPSAPRPPPFATDGEWWWSVAGRHSRVFVRRVELEGRHP